MDNPNDQRLARVAQLMEQQVTTALGKAQMDLMEARAHMQVLAEERDAARAANAAILQAAPPAEAPADAAPARTIPVAGALDRPAPIERPDPHKELADKMAAEGADPHETFTDLWTGD